jgi:hypothetical protein
MPRGHPKRPILFRIDPNVIEQVTRYTDNVTGAVEEGLVLWLKRAKRRPIAPEQKPEPIREDAA